MKLFKNLELQTKVSIYSAILLVFAFFVLGIVVFGLQRERLENIFYENISQQLKAINKSIIDLNTKKERLLKNSIELSSYIFQENSIIKESNEKIELLSRNELTKESTRIKVKVWRNQGMQLQTNSEMVDKIKSFTGVDIGIFQQTRNGYILISTTILNRRNERAIGTFYPNSATICKIIEKGEKFSGKISIDNILYLVMAKPYFIKGRTRGFIISAKPLYNKKEIADIIKNLYLIPHSSINIIDKDNKLIYSNNELKLTFPIKITNYSIKQNEITVIKNITDDFNTNYLYATYLKSIGYYMVLEIPKSIVLNNLNKFKILLLISMLITVIFLFIGMYLIFNKFGKDLNSIKNILEEISLGKKLYISTTPFSKEFAIILNYISILDKNNSDKITFINELKENKLDTEFKLLSNEDEMGKALLDLRGELKKTANTIKSTKEHDERVKWFNSGRSKISDILREYSSNIVGLGDELIKEIVHFLEIPVGGIFIISEDKKKNKYLDMLSTFAYNRKKFIEKKIPYGDGLIGACAAEQYTMHIKGIPSDYIHIESGLGGKSPDYLLLIPIVADNATLGVIELAAFEEFSEQKINYIESISEAIASTITITRLNTQTSILLEESKEQIEMLEKDRDKLSQELNLLKDKFEKLRRDFTDSEFQYKTQIVKKQMTIDNLNRRIENLEIS